MPNPKLAVLASKVLEKYMKLWDERFFTGSDITATDSFSLDLMNAPLGENAKNAVQANDFNFVLTLNCAQKIMKRHEDRYVNVGDQEAAMTELWSIILKDLYGCDTKLNLENRAKQNDNLLNNIWPILESVTRILDGFEMTQPQKESMDGCLAKLGYCRTEKSLQAFKKQKEKLGECNKKIIEFQKLHREDEKKIVELEAQLKKYTKIFNKLKAI